MLTHPDSMQPLGAWSTPAAGAGGVPAHDGPRGGPKAWLRRGRAQGWTDAARRLLKAGPDQAENRRGGPWSG